VHDLRNDSLGLRLRKLVTRNKPGNDFMQRYSERESYEQSPAVILWKKNEPSARGGRLIVTLIQVRYVVNRLPRVLPVRTIVPLPELRFGRIVSIVPIEPRAVIRLTPLLFAHFSLSDAFLVIVICDANSSRRAADENIACASRAIGQRRSKAS